MQAVKCRKTVDKNVPGFTVIEVVVVLVVIGILAVVALPRLFSLTPNEIDSEVEILKANLHYAQSRAMCDNVPWGIAFNGNSYTLQKNSITATSNLPNENSASHILEGNISAGGATIKYDRWGSPGSVSRTITLSGGDTSKTITVVNTTGFIQ